MINNIVIKVSGKTIGVLSDMKISNKTYDKVYELKADCVKLNEEQVREIKQLLREGKLSHNMIAKRYDISRRAITNINTGLSWRHVK